VDGCGGYLLISGERWTVGGATSQAHQADIVVRADLPRLAGTLERSGGDYFWKGGRQGDARELVRRGKVLAMEGSARLILDQPSALCDSAILKLEPPHRFDEHVDAVILASDTILLGNGRDCHIRCRESSDRAVLIRRGDRWMAKAGLAGEAIELQPGRRTMLQNLALTLEET
jgi:hypothetical protein